MGDADAARAGGAGSREGIAHAAILLAAGASTRLGRAKQLIGIDGESLLRRAAFTLLASTPLELLVVLGHDAARMRDALADLPLRIVLATAHASGMSSSLRAGVAALDAACAGALIAPTDQPALDAAHLIALGAAWRAAPERAVASAYADLLGVPALLPRTWFAEVAKLRGDIGARELLRGRAREVVAIGASALENDLDTLAGLDRKRRQGSAKCALDRSWLRRSRKINAFPGVAQPRPHQRVCTSAPPRPRHPSIAPD